MTHTPWQKTPFTNKYFSLQPQTAARILFAIFMLMGILVRIWQFGIVPGDIHQDEAFAGYEWIPQVTAFPYT